MSYDNLLAGAAAAAGTAPTDQNDYRRWLDRVAKIAADLGDLAESVAAHEQRRADCVALGETDGKKKSFYGKLVKAKSITKGSGEKTVVKGYLQFAAKEDSQSVDDEGFEFIETSPLSTPEGAFEFQRAQSLVGQDVVVYKRLIPLANGRRARECAAIDPAPGSSTAALMAPLESQQSVEEEHKVPPVPTPAPKVVEPVDLEAAVSSTEEMFASPTPVVSTETTSATATSVDLASMTPKTEQELVDLANRHLGKSADEIRSILVEKYNVPAGKTLPPRQYASVWAELVD